MQAELTSASGYVAANQNNSHRICNARNSLFLIVGSTGQVIAVRPFFCTRPLNPLRFYVRMYKSSRQTWVKSAWRHCDSPATNHCRRFRTAHPKDTSRRSAAATFWQGAGAPDRHSNTPAALVITACDRMNPVYPVGRTTGWAALAIPKAKPSRQ